MVGASERGRHRETETQRDRETERHRHTETQRQRDKDKDRESKERDSKHAVMTAMLLAVHRLTPSPSCLQAGGVPMYQYPPQTYTATPLGYHPPPYPPRQVVPVRECAGALPTHPPPFPKTATTTTMRPGISPAPLSSVVAECRRCNDAMALIDPFLCGYIRRV